MKKLKLLNKYSYLHSINGSLIEAELDDVSVGEVCEIYASWQANERIANFFKNAAQRIDTSCQGLITNNNIFPY
ncbi:ATP synthase SpaL [Escherichia coli O157:H- str. 493-89]|nr:ATP synthase SpaL [Escherichia coli O157:H- str. 493-89]